MKIDVLTLFPDMFKGPFSESIINRSQEKDLVEIKIHNLRDWAQDKHKTVDDSPYGGGAGMLMRVDVIDKAVSELKAKDTKGILMDAGGNTFNQGQAGKLSEEKHLILISGHYEGVDYRVHEHIADEVISIGDYVLTGGELPAMVVVDSLVRLIPGVIKKESTEDESFSAGMLEYPQYTRPEGYKGWQVPEVLKSGNHREIDKWRKEQGIERTKKRRPDLIK